MKWLPSMSGSIARTMGMLAGLAAMVVAVSSVHGADWPQWLGPGRDGVWTETGIVQTLPKEGLKPKWRTPIGSGYSGPAVAAGRVYVMDRRTPAEVKPPADAFARGQIPGRERVLCLDAANGKIVWEHAYDCSYTVSYASGPRATPVVTTEAVYTLGAEGHLFCLRANDGQVVWSKDLQKEYATKTPTWGFSGHPLVDGNKLICLVGGAGSVVVAFDRVTGRELWRALSAKEPGYAPPMIYEFGGRRQLILWHPEALTGLDPETGELLWTHAMQPAVRFGLTVASPRKAGADLLYLSSFYNGSLLLRVGATNAEPVWRSRKVSEKETEGLHTIMATPWIEEGHIYGPCSYGEFRCIKLGTGERVWETFAPTSGKSARWGNAFVVKHADRSVLISEQGDLIFAKLTPAGYQELSRAKLIEPDNHDARRPVVWSHPAFANRSIYMRNDSELICVSLSEQ